MNPKLYLLGWLVLALMTSGCARLLGPAPEPVFVIAPYTDPADNPAVQAKAVTGRNERFFQRRHDRIQQRIADQETIDLLFVGDSIMQFWEARYSDLFEQYYGQRNPVNFGISSDQTENVLWRIENTEFAGKHPKLAIVLIGTNNIGNSNHTAEQTADGVIAVCRALRMKFPQTKLLLLAIFPRADKGPEVQAQVEAANAMIEPIGDERWIYYRDLSDAFLAEDGSLPSDTFPDRLHPGPLGYELWAKTIEPEVARLLGE